MSDAAARALAADLPATPEEAQARYSDYLWNQVEQQRDVADRKATDRAQHRATLQGGLDDLRVVKHQLNTGFLPVMAFKSWLQTGQINAEYKAALVEDAVGRVIVPVDIVVDVLREVELRSVFRELVPPRPTTRDRQRQGLLGAAAAGWGKLETGGSLTDANVLPEASPLEIEVHDAVALCKVGEDELDDSPAAVRQSLIEAIADAVLGLEDVAFSVGSGTGEPRGLAAAANVSRVSASQKTAAGVSATPTIADLAVVVSKLPARYRRRAVWLFSEDAFAKILALQWTSGDSLMPRAGQGEGPFGWNYRVAPLPSMATAGATDASVWFTDLAAAYRIVDRSALTVQRLEQRYRESGVIGFLVRKRVGGDMVRPEAASVYTL